MATVAAHSVPRSGALTACSWGLAKSGNLAVQQIGQPSLTLCGSEYGTCRRLRPTDALTCEEQQGGAPAPWFSCVYDKLQQVGLEASCGCLSMLFMVGQLAALQQVRFVLCGSWLSTG